MAFVTVAPKQPRPVGLVTSNWIVVPPGVARMTLRALMNNPDMQDSTLSIPFRIMGSLDAGATNYLLVGGAWQGGSPNRDGSFTPPTAVVQPSPIPTHVRGEAELPRSLNIGLEAEVV